MNISGNLNIQYYVNNLYTECVLKETKKSLVQYWLGCMASDINEKYGKRVCSVIGARFKWHILKRTKRL